MKNAGTIITKRPADSIGGGEYWIEKSIPGKKMYILRFCPNFEYQIFIVVYAKGKENAVEKAERYLREMPQTYHLSEGPFEAATGRCKHTTTGQHHWEGNYWTKYVCRLCGKADIVL